MLVKAKKITSNGLVSFQLDQYYFVNTFIQYFYCHINGHLYHLLRTLLMDYIKHSLVKLSVLVSKSRLTLFCQVSYNFCKKLLSVLLCCACWVAPHSVLCNLRKSAWLCRKFLNSLYFLLAQALCY